MAIQTNIARDATLNINRLCEAVNGIDQNSKTAVLSALREMFPEIIWTKSHDGRVSGAVHEGYRP